VGDRDRDVLLRDEVLDRDLRRRGHDLGPPRLAVGLPQLLELADDDSVDPPG
jgi:hypothetical protein